VEAEIKKAAELATTVDQVVVFAGLNKDWESEGFDRPHMDLPGHQDRLIEAVALANPRTVVVLQSGTPVTTPWASSVGAIVQAWYGGNETGSAIADVLYGHVNPSGKLPVSWPRCNEDNPAFLNYRSDGGRCIYGEDVYVGYRFYEKVRREVQWPFGHGLSYTSFQMDSLEVNVDGETLTVTFSIANVGTRPGAEVPQIYVSPENPSGVGRPLKELKGFRKVYLEPGEQRSVTVDIPIKYATSYWHEEQGCWFSQKDVYRVSVGPSSSVAALVGAFTTSRTMTWTGI
jgi:beta-glucosidase